MKLYLLFIISSLILFSSCSNDDEDDFEEINSTARTFGIRDDRTLIQYEAIATNESPYNTNDYPDFSPVVSFTYSLDGSDDYEFVATGVLIHSDWILTAGHNFYISDDQNEPAIESGILVNFGIDPNNPDFTREVEELVFFPSWLFQDDVYGYGNDLCLVRLSNPVINITPAIVYGGDDENIGGTTWYAGFGDYSQQPGNDPDLYSLKHAIENVLDRKVDGILSEDANGNTYFGGLVAFDFDSPDGSINALGDDYEGEDEVLLGGGTSEATVMEFEGCTVEGDSGGPLFLNMDGNWVVIGILSGSPFDPIPNYKDGSYGDISIFIRVSTATDWITSVINDPV